MSKIKIVLEDKGIRELMKDKSIVGACEDVANEIVSHYGGSGTVSKTYKTTRGYASVETTDETNELLIAMGKAKKVRGSSK